MKHIIIVGAGLAGLSCAVEHVEKGFKVTVLERSSIVVGRTSSWNEKGMHIESGLHRYLGFYTYLPNLFKKAELDFNDVLVWEDEIEFRIPDTKINAVYHVSPLRRPIKSIVSLFKNSNFLGLRELIDLIKISIKGIYKYLKDPLELDKVSTLSFSQKNKVSQKFIDRFLVPTTEGIFFLNPSQYSAYVYFGVTTQAMPYIYKMGIAAFKGGMTEVMCKPIADFVTKKGGEVLTKMNVEKLIT